MIKRWISMILCVVIILTTTPFSTWASEAATSSEVTYGSIQIANLDTGEYRKYEAAIDEDQSAIYISVEEFIELLSLAIRKNDARNTIELSDNIRTVTIYLEDDIADLSIQILQCQSEEFSKYGFELDSITDEEGTCYLPLEKLLYMFGCEWFCQSKTVFITQPDTLLDIVNDSSAMVANNATYSIMTGNDFGTAMKNAFKWSFFAAFDEIDMTFIKDSILTTIHMKDMMKIEENALQKSLLELQSDIPENINMDDYRNNTMQNMSDYDMSEEALLARAEGYNELLSVLLDAGDTIKTNEDAVRAIQSNTALYNSFGINVPIKDTPKFVKTLGNTVGVGLNLMNYAMSVGQIYWQRENLASGLESRLEYIENNLNTDNETYEQLAKNAKYVREEYCEDFANVLFKVIDLDMIASTVDGVFSLGGVEIASSSFALSGLHTMSTCVAVMRMAALASRKITFINNLAVEGDTALDGLWSLHLTTAMRKQYCKEILNLFNTDVTQETFDNIRICAQIMENSSLHAHEKLIKIGAEMKADTYYDEVVYLNRLSESSKYDQLLFLDTAYGNLYSDDIGCVREVIPLEYLEEKESPLYEYMRNLDWLTEDNSYTELSHNNWKLNSGINEGVVTALITDIDGDSQDELLYLELKNTSNPLNALYMVVVEEIESEAVETARALLSTDSCLCGCPSEEHQIAYQNGKLLYVGKIMPSEAYTIFYTIAGYNGSEIIIEKQLYNPGYSSGSALFDVTNGDADNYYYTGIELYSYEEGFGTTGKYGSYSVAIANELSTFNVTGDDVNTYIADDLLICIMTASTNGGYYSSVVYSSIENRGLNQESEPED